MGRRWSGARRLRARSEQDPTKIAEFYEAGIARLPLSSELHANFALFLSHNRKNFDAAESMYKRAQELDPDAARNTENYALFLSDNRKDLDAAEAMYKRALELDPENVRNTGNYALFLARDRKDFDEADAMYKKALALDPEDAINTGNYAVFLARDRGNFDAAEAMCEKAQELDPSNANYPANFASLILRRGANDDFSLARSLSRRSVQLSKPTPSQAAGEALLYLCLISELHGDDFESSMGRLKQLIQTEFIRGSWDRFLMSFYRKLMVIDGNCMRRCARQF